jgi:hypothetical protein
MDEGRKRVLTIVAGILVARHLKTTEDLFDNRGSPSPKGGGLEVSQYSGVRIVFSYLLDDPD